jgi:hypothetical protein
MTLSEEAPDRNLERWSRLREVVQNGGLPWYADITCCNFRNCNIRPSHSNDVDPGSAVAERRRSRQRKGIHTILRGVDCQHSFPQTTYNTFTASRADASAWDRIMRGYDRDYPWEEKIN